MVVENDRKEILLVKHNRESKWALPGGHIERWDSSPRQRAAIEVAEETGIIVENVQAAGRYAGKVAVHHIFTAEGTGRPRLDRKELQAARWWNGRDRLPLQPHVSIILAIVRNK